MRSRAGRIVLWVIVALLALGAVLAFVMFGPPKQIERFARPEFCASCHVMDPQYAAFKQSVHSELESCNDCHLPNDGFIRHYVWEGIVGVRDLVEFNLNLIPEHITARERSKDWVEENCRRCHAEVITNIHPQAGRRCWECHREMYHDYETRFDRTQRRPIWQDEE